MNAKAFGYIGAALLAAASIACGSGRSEATPKPVPTPKPTATATPEPQQVDLVYLVDNGEPGEVSYYRTWDGQPSVTVPRFNRPHWTDSSKLVRNLGDLNGDGKSDYVLRWVNAQGILVTEVVDGRNLRTIFVDSGGGKYEVKRVPAGLILEGTYPVVQKGSEVSYFKGYYQFLPVNHPPEQEFICSRVKQEMRLKGGLLEYGVPRCDAPDVPKFYVDEFGSVFDEPGPGLAEIKLPLIFVRDYNLGLVPVAYLSPSVADYNGDGKLDFGINWANPYINLGRYEFRIIDGTAEGVLDENAVYEKTLFARGLAYYFLFAYEPPWMIVTERQEYANPTMINGMPCVKEISFYSIGESGRFEKVETACAKPAN